MIGTTLAEIRRHVEELATEDGDYCLVCGRTGDRPTPAENLRFESRAVAREATKRTGQYRAALRRYDPRLPHYDVIVCEDAGPVRQAVASTHQGQTDEWCLSEPVIAGSPTEVERRERIEFCHRVAAAVWETLSDGAHDGVESAIMDAYFEHAESVTEPDDLCLRLLESMATELSDRLSPSEQANLLARAGAKLSRTGPSEKPVVTTLALLRERGVLDGFTCAPVSMDLQRSRRTVVGEVTDYALSPQNGRLPVLPVVVELFRQCPDRPPSKLRAVDIEGGWRLEIELAREDEPVGLANAPITPSQ